MSIDPTDPPTPPAGAPSQHAEPDREADGSRRGLADRQTLDRRTIDDSFARKRRELEVPTSLAPGEPDPSASGPSEPTASEATVPEATAPEATVPESTVPEATVPEATAPSRPQLRLNSKRQVVVAASLLVGVSLTLGLVAGTCFGGAPETPLEALGIGSAAHEAGISPADDAASINAAPVDTDQLDTDQLDPEQQAFAERRERELAAEPSDPEPGSTVPDFTDDALVKELAGSWRLDLGRGRRGYQVRFGSDPVRAVHRQRFDVTLFDVVGRGLPPYFTVLDLPDGKLLAFLDASGTFRLVLEDVRRESDGRLSWRGPLRERRFGVRLDGESAWRFGRERDEEAPRADREPEPRPSNEPPTLGVGAQPRPLSKEVATTLYDAVERHLDELSFGLMERDAERVYALWGGRPDAVTRAAVEELLDRYTALRVWTRLLTLDVASTEDGPQARFEVVVTIQGAPQGARNRRDVDLRDVRWRGRLGLRESGGQDVPIQLDPFSG